MGSFFPAFTAALVLAGIAAALPVSEVAAQDGASAADLPRFLTGEIEDILGPLPTAPASAGKSGQ